MKIIIWALGLSFVVVVLAGSLALAADAPYQPLLIGAEWPYTPSDSDSVKQLFYESGMNFARVTGGGYSWAIANHTQAVAELEAHGVKVVLQLGSHYPSGDYFKFTDSFFVDHAGGTGVEDRNVWAITYSGVAWPQYSYASETYRPQMEGDFSRYLAAFKDRTNVAGIILHNEPGLFWLTDRLFDYNPKMIARFSTWLRERYGQIATLNAAWGSQYASFDAVEPPHQLPPVDNLAAYMDWRRAQTDVIHDFMQWEIAATRAAWPGMPLTTNLAGPLESWFPIRCADNFLFTEGMDAAGVDIYPETWSTKRFTGYTMDLTRGVAQGRPVWVLEAQTYDEQKWSNRTPEQLAGMLRAEVWAFIGHGARGVCLWSLSGRSGWNLTRGEFNPRVAAMREIAHTSEMLRLGDFRKPHPQVAVVVDPDSFFYHGGQNANMPWFLDKTGAGMNGALADAGYDSDVLFAEQVRRGAASGYRVLALTNPVMIDDSLAGKLNEFVQGGGLLIAEAPLGEVDLAGRQHATRPGCGLDALFGIRVTSTSGANVKAPNVGGVSISAARFRSEIEPAGATVIGTFPDGKPAVTVNTVGTGTAIFIAAGVSEPYGDGWAGPGLRTFLKSRIEPVVPAPFTITHSGSDMLDAGLLADARGNQALVFAVPPDKGVPPAPITNVQVSFDAAQVDGLTAACLLSPTTVANGRISSVPRLLPIDTTGGTTARINVGTVSSAALLLLARDMRPVLGIDAPVTAATGSEFTVTATCIDLSPGGTPGSIDLILPPGWGKPDLGIREGRTAALPSGQQAFAFTVKAPAFEQRAVIKACFTIADAPPDTARIVSVPIDVQVQCPCVLPGDTNGDCRVNILDLIFIRGRLGNGIATDADRKADVNEDGTINILDLIAVRNRLNTKCE